MQPELKLCINCEHFNHMYGTGQAPRCFRPALPTEIKISLVTGEKQDTRASHVWYAENVRENIHDCGPEGKYFRGKRAHD